MNNQGIATATGPTVSNVTTTDDTIAFAVRLDLPGDFFEFTIDMVNEGKIDGIISAVSKNIYDKDDYDENGDEATPINPEDLTFTVVYDGNQYTNGNSGSYDVYDGEEPSKGDVFGGRINYYSNHFSDPERLKVRVRVEFNEDATTVSATDRKYMCVYKVTYQQYKKAPYSERINIKTSDTTIDLGDDVNFDVYFWAVDWNIVVSVDGSVYDDTTFVGSTGTEYDTWVDEDYAISGLTAGTHTINFKGEVNNGNDYPPYGPVIYIDRTYTITVE